MRIVAILIISIYAGTVSCISDKSCDLKCKFLHGHNVTARVIKKVCHCVTIVQVGLLEHTDDDDYDCSSNYYGAYGFSKDQIKYECLTDYNCNISDCLNYCNYEHEGEEYSPICYKGIECRCQPKKEHVCIISTNINQDLIEYNPQNNIAINDILFNLKNLLNTQLCPLYQKSDHGDPQVFVVNGTIINSDFHNLTYNECEISCQLDSDCPRCFNCGAQRNPGKIIYM